VVSGPVAEIAFQEYIRSLAYACMVELA